MKVLWFSNIEINDNISSTGTWIFTMANELLASGQVELINITEGNVDKFERRDIGKLKQLIIPKSKLKKGLPNNDIIEGIVEWVEEIKPDMIHIWGTENFWGLLFSRGFLHQKVIIDIQGLKYIWCKYFFTGLTINNIFGCIAFKDFIRPQFSIFGRAKSFKKWGNYELEILKKINNIGVQSKWVHSHMKIVNPRANLFESKIQLRKPFLISDKWNKNNCEQYRIFTSTSAVLSYKGLHILIEAISLLKKNYPNIKLAIAGHISNKGIRQNGYDKFVINKIEKNNLSDNIIWLGSLDAESLAKELLKSNVCVVPSFIESYCVALEEALTLGTPSVVSFSGAMPELAKHEFSALYYSSTDAVDCASQIEKLFEFSRAETISKNAVESKKERLNKINFAQEQLNVYRSIINNE